VTTEPAVMMLTFGPIITSSASLNVKRLSAAVIAIARLTFANMAAEIRPWRIEAHVRGLREGKEVQAFGTGDREIRRKGQALRRACPIRWQFRAYSVQPSFSDSGHRQQHVLDSDSIQRADPAGIRYR
jgi:hypothetical protein